MNGLSTVLPASEARANWYDLLDEVSTKLKTFAITLRGKVKAIVINPDELESWRETMEIMADKKLVANIRKSQQQFKKGQYIAHEQLLKDLGLDGKVK